jgi:cell division transport system permease protein
MDRLSKPGRAEPGPIVRALQYDLEEALASLWRGRRANLLAVITITTAMFVLGGFLVATSNLRQVVTRWSAAAEFSVFLRDGLTSQQRSAIERMLDQSGLATSREYISKAEALVRFKRDFPDLAAGTEGLEDNPFPASLEVRLRSAAVDRRALESLAARLEKTDGVADVRYDRRWLDRLMAIMSLVQWAGIALSGVLVVAAALTVANVVRLALYVRRDEVEIMQLVGAPIAYIRGPFVVEGILQGGMGAVLAIVLLALAFGATRARYGALAVGFFGPSSIEFLPIHLSALLVLGGMVVGCMGGWVAARSAR